MINVLKIMVGALEALAVYVGNTQVWTKETLPYDKEVLYLLSSGTLYIDTGIVNNSTVIIDCKMSGEGTDVLNGSEYSTSYKFKWGIGGAGNPYIGYGNINNNYNYEVPVYITDIFLYHLEQDSLTISDISGNVLSSSTATLSKYATQPICLFKQKRGSNITTTNGNMRIYYCNIEINNILHEFIPVRIGLIGYMYDKQTGLLFSNAGSGDFIIGPDIS